eukprot:6181371-Pleurochrysis_carterae.AAC.7
MRYGACTARGAPFARARGPSLLKERGSPVKERARSRGGVRHGEGCGEAANARRFATNQSLDAAGSRGDWRLKSCDEGRHLDGIQMWGGRALACRRQGRFRAYRY